MKKALAGVLAVAFIGCMAGAAVAQVPYVQVYFDAALTETQSPCMNQPGGSGPPVDLHVVYINWNMNISEVEFSISYPPSLIWLGDNRVDPDTQEILGSTPVGVAVATATAARSTDSRRWKCFVRSCCGAIVTAPRDRNRSSWAVTRPLARSSRRQSGEKISRSSSESV